jgi:hypothetical protein
MAAENEDWIELFKQKTSWLGTQEVDAIVQAYYPQDAGARAIADVLLGIRSPSGKLATTWLPTRNATVLPGQLY